MKNNQRRFNTRIYPCRSSRFARGPALLYLRMQLSDPSQDTMKKSWGGVPLHLLFPADRAENAAFLRYLNRLGVSRHHHMPEAVLVTRTGRCRHTRLLIDYFRNTKEPFRCARICILVDPSTRKERGLVRHPEKGPDSLINITCKSIHDRIFSLRCNRELMEVEMSRVNSPRFTTLLSRIDDNLDMIASLVDRFSSMNDEGDPHTR